MDRISQLLLLRMGELHREGSFGESIASLSGELGISTGEIEHARKQLRTAGLLDDVEDPTLICLSATGLRTAQTLELGDRLVDGQSLSGAALPIKNDGCVPSAEMSAIGFRLFELYAAWIEVVAQSTVGEDEKMVLRRLGEQFFQHPASVTLLAQALQRVGVRVGEISQEV